MTYGLFDARLADGIDNVAALANLG
jgi:hypothetical protein